MTGRTNTLDSDRRTMLQQHLTVYEWNAWDGYLIASLAGDAQRIPASLADTAENLFAMLRPGTRAFLFHLDLTYGAGLPAGRSDLIQALQASGCRVLNADLTDVSKREVQAVCRRVGARCLAASRAGAEDEMVIVKTNLNCHGRPEERLTGEQLERLVPPGAVAVLETYPVLRREAVADDLWDAGALSIERYVENRSGRFYRAYVAGTHIILSESATPGVIKKMGRGLPRTNYFAGDGSTAAGYGAAPSALIHEAFEQVRMVRQGFAMDFGAIDLVEDDQGSTYVCDVNPTPYWGESEPLMDDFLRAGLLETITR